MQRNFEFFLFSQPLCPVVRLLPDNFHNFQQNRAPHRWIMTQTHISNTLTHLHILIHIHIHIDIFLHFARKQTKNVVHFDFQISNFEQNRVSVVRPIYLPVIEFDG